MHSTIAVDGKRMSEADQTSREPEFFSARILLPSKGPNMRAAINAGISDIEISPKPFMPSRDCAMKIGGNQHPKVNIMPAKYLLL